MVEYVAKPKDLGLAETPGQFLGSELRLRREKAGYSQCALGGLLYCSGSFIGQLEAGTRKLQPDFARQLDRVLDCGDFFERLARAVYKSRHADYFADAAEHEAMALTISEYAPAIVPGILQTEAYARAVVRAFEPLAPESDVEDRVTARTDRAAILKNPTAPMLWAILHEHVLRLPVGGSTVMHGQLTHIANLIRQGRILVQVLPVAAGAHAAMAGMVSIMTFAEAPPVAYAEGLLSGTLLDSPDLVIKCSRIYDLLRAAALSPEASLAMIASVTEDYAT
ncbi:Scr1 family TA system antitoxin-like transcriptional regulator [Streptomyces sp. NPDC057686]|uniref:helix-turn-helix domain-containing protein n=1 Tax=Streptomyces sp. NPDC057686 TaxID=3346212 RepID=UPI0036AB9499